MTWSIFQNQTRYQINGRKKWGFRTFNFALVSPKEFYEAKEMKKSRFWAKKEENRRFGYQN